MGSLTFDKCGGDQVVQLTNWEDANGQVRGLSVGERLGSDAWLGRSQNGRVALELCDPLGRPRIALAVSPEGDPSVEVLDPEGRTVWSAPLPTIP
jgi:hypothetical protein